MFIFCYYKLRVALDSFMPRINWLMITSALRQVASNILDDSSTSYHKSTTVVSVSLKTLLTLLFDQQLSEHKNVAFAHASICHARRPGRSTTSDKDSQKTGQNELRPWPSQRALPKCSGKLWRYPRLTSRFLKYRSNDLSQGLVYADTVRAIRKSWKTSFDPSWQIKHIAVLSVTDVGHFKAKTLVNGMSKNCLVRPPRNAGCITAACITLQCGGGLKRSGMRSISPLLIANGSCARRDI